MGGSVTVCPTGRSDWSDKPVGRSLGRADQSGRQSYRVNAQLYFSFVCLSVSAQDNPKKLQTSFEKFSCKGGICTEQQMIRSGADADHDVDRKFLKRILLWRNRACRKSFELSSVSECSWFVCKAKLATYS